jgi:hypothetical protein
VGRKAQTPIEFPDIRLHGLLKNLLRFINLSPSKVEQTLTPKRGHFRGAGQVLW